MGVLGGKSAVVTGGSRGIGRAIVERLAGDGAAVVFNYARSSEAAAQVERAVRDVGGRAHAVQIDLAEPGAADHLMAAAAEHLDGLDILVNNAALDFGTPRLGQPDDIADVVALLASHEGRWLTGQVIHATGGLA